MLKYRLLLVVCLLNLFGVSLKGQESTAVPNALIFKHITPKEGLSQTSVITILQDYKGYLWFGTRDGLNKYDGSKFITFRHNSEDPLSLSHSWITCIFEDTDNNLWIGTKNGLNKYNPEKENFTPYKHKANAQSVSDNEICDVIQIDDHTLCVSTDKGLTNINIVDGSFSHLFAQKNKSNTLSNNKTRALLKDSNDWLWICTQTTIDAYNLKTNHWKHYSYPKKESQKQIISNTPRLYEDAQNNIWIGHEKGLAIYDKKSDAFIEYKHNGKPVTKSPVRSFSEDDNENLWIGTYTGLHIIDKEHKLIKKYIHDENNPTSLSQNSIYKILKDSKGDMWIGTWAGAVNYFDHSFQSFKQIASGATNTMLNYKVVSAIIEDDNGDMWIGTEGGGVNYYNKTSGRFTYYTHNEKAPRSLSSNNVKSMIKDHEGNLWIGTHDGGLNFLDRSKKPYIFKKFEQKQADGFQIKDFRILSLLEDVNHNIWIGTLTGGVVFYDRSSELFTRLEYNYKSTENISQSLNPNILFLGSSKGLEQIDINSKQIDKIKVLETDSDVTQTFNCIYEAPNNILWIGTEGLGLFEYNFNTKKTKKYGISQGLTNEVIYGILPGNEDDLWISTNNGIFRFNTVTKKIKNFDELDGLQGNEFNYGAYHKTKNGVLIYGGTNGITYFNPNDITENTFIPNVDIYALKINNIPYKNITDTTSQINLTYTQNDFNFNFTSLSFSKSEKNQFAYKLEGFDTEWNYIGNKKEANYTNIDEGNYVFRVKAANNDGLWNEKGASIRINIEPAPWKTWWAYLLYVLLLITILYFTRKLILTRISEKNELKQEKLDKERIEEVNQMKLKLFTNISHDFRTPLTLIIGPLQRMIKENMGNAFIQQQHEIMQRNANMLLQLVTQLLDFRKSESGKLELHAAQSNFISFAQNIKAAFDDLANHKNIKYTFETEDEDIQLWFDKIKMKKILFNLLSNAFKYSPDNHDIFIEIATSKNELILKITNFGEIIPREDLQHIFDRFYRFDQEGIKSGTGIGLALTKSLVELHKGKISVSSSAELGTSFTVKFLIGRGHLKDSECVEETGQLNSDLGDNKPFLIEGENSKEQNEQPVATEINKDTPSLLIVEDNTDVRNFVKDIFKDKYNIFEAENGKIAVTIAHKNDIDLIVSDVMMPEMDGFELCKHIKTNLTTSHIPIVLLTAKTASTHQERGYKIGADAYITKPFDAAILEVRVDNLLATQKNLIGKFKKDAILKPKELTITSADELFLEKAIQIIEDNLSDPEFNVYVFTEQMNMSRSVLYRKLKALTDQSITEFIRTIKLKKAAQLIAKTQMNISEIAYEIGFNDLKYFRNCFKKQFGELPSAYRTKNS